ncbi:major royal jelly protein 1-like [Planococcus citri]|uniref:major royal jelly protein 1-like n=1 Tax=Planococcus citri TaxID=170843 RepID=UPI0031F92655
MVAKLIIILCVFKCYFCDFGKEVSYNISLVLRWETLDFEWPDKDRKLESVTNRTFVPKNNFIRGFRLWQDFALITIPRWKSGVPVTLAKLTTATNSSDGRMGSPVLQPYPSWAMQNIDDCYALQSAHSIEIDSDEKLWVLDNGMIEELEHNRTVCPAKLMIIDLKSNFIIRTLIIPSEMTRPGSTFTSMAIDKYKQIAYIPDSIYDQSGFIVYDFNIDSFKRFDCEHLNVDDETFNFNNIPENLWSQFVSVSLNTDRNKLYFSIFDSDDLFFVRVSVFDENITDISTRVENLGKYGRSVQLTADPKGYMYFDVLNRKAVAQWRENSWVFQYTPHIVVQSKLLCHWISSLDIDSNGYLWIASTRFYDYVSNKVNDHKDNFRIFKVFVPRMENPKKPKTGFNAEYVVLVLFIIIIGLIIVEILMFNSD